MRGKKTPKHEILPDPRYQSVVVANLLTALCNAVRKPWPENCLSGL